MNDRYFDGRRWRITGRSGNDLELTAEDGEIIVRSKQWVNLWTAPVQS